MSIFSRGWLAAGITTVVVGSVGIVSVLNAHADEVSSDTIAEATSAAAPEPVDPSAPERESGVPELDAAAIDPADVASAIDLPDTLPFLSKVGPTGKRVRPMRVGTVGASSESLAESGAVAAPVSTDPDPVPVFAAKGENEVAPPAPLGMRASATSFQYHYATRRQNLVAVNGETPTVSGGADPSDINGALAWIPVAQPAVRSGDVHSLAEVAVMSYDPTDPDGKRLNAVEVGWHVDPGAYPGTHAAEPHLFVYAWINGVGQCYNGCGWVEYAVKPTIKPGDVLAQTVAGDPGLQFGIEHSDDNGAWYISLANSRGVQYLGGFPDSLWGGQFTHPDRVQVFGEVASLTSATPCSEMGNGIEAISKSSVKVSGLTLMWPNWNFNENDPSTWKANPRNWTTPGTFRAVPRPGETTADTSPYPQADVNVYKTAPDGTRTIVQDPAQFRFGGPGFCGG